MIITVTMKLNEGITPLPPQLWLHVLCDAIFSRLGQWRGPVPVLALPPGRLWRDSGGHQRLLPGGQRELRTHSRTPHRQRGIQQARISCRIHTRELRGDHLTTSPSTVYWILPVHLFQVLNFSSTFCGTDKLKVLQFLAPCLVAEGFNDNTCQSDFNILWNDKNATDCNSFEQFRIKTQQFWVVKVSFWLVKNLVSKAISLPSPSLYCFHCAYF